MTKSKKNEAANKAVETITSYKGFDKNLQCRGFQYEIGKTFKHKGKVKACGSGFHACEYPLDVFGYYAPGELNRFAVVEQSGDLSRGDDDTKVASKSITIKAEVDIPFLVKAAIEYTTSRCEPIKEDSPAFTDKDHGQAVATGYKSASSATGDNSASSATGDNSASSATGYNQQALLLATTQQALLLATISKLCYWLQISKLCYWRQISKLCYWQLGSKLNNRALF
ncbi:hypothetical protein ACIN5074_2179 [Acinetobacter baumannii OIFC074]|uniref:DUF7666 domain-containing protein n=1 Tax=Acinetobacter baumannii TaxID=470 RepID=UPI00028E93BF|nr:hypothetical protein [Acinetobacter baumannii]EKL44019.1 hypothetical protein ACIN5074_2179 [Acinetobacter baumannii OIFC074]